MPQQLLPPPVAEAETRSLLHRRDKIRLISVEVRRNLDRLIELQEAFEASWITSDPSDVEAGRAVITDLIEEIARAKNSVYELRRLTQP
jgi:hypothetical protein